MRAFVRLREFLVQNNEIISNIEELKQRVNQSELSEKFTMSSITDLSEDTPR